MNLLKLPKSVLLNAAQKQFSKKFKREVVEASILIDYEKNKFTLQVWDKDSMSIKQSAPVSDFTDMSGMLLERIKERLKQERDTDKIEVDILDLRVKFADQTSKAKVFFVENGQKLLIEVTEVF